MGFQYDYEVCVCVCVLCVCGVWWYVCMVCGVYDVFVYVYSSVCVCMVCVCVCGVINDHYILLSTVGVSDLHVTYLLHIPPNLITV